MKQADIKGKSTMLAHLDEIQASQVTPCRDERRNS